MCKATNWSLNKARTLTVVRPSAWSVPMAKTWSVVRACILAVENTFRLSILKTATSTGSMAWICAVVIATICAVTSLLI